MQASLSPFAKVDEMWDNDGLMAEQLTPYSPHDDVLALELAYEANKAFDKRRMAAYALAEPTTDSPVAREEDILNADRTYHAYVTAAATLMSPHPSFEAESKEVSLASEAVWQAMTPEQQATALELRSTIATSPLRKYGVTEESLRILQTANEGGDPVFTLTHVGLGVDIGSLNPSRDTSYLSVMNFGNDDLFDLEIGNRYYNTRYGMTAAVYAAVVEDARERGVVLPDSQPQTTDNGEIWTMLTGETDTSDGKVSACTVINGKVVLRTFDLTYQSLLIRPAVVIE